MSQNEFSYFISLRGSFVVITFNGALYHSSMKQLAEARKEISSKVNQKFVILNLLGVENVTGDAIAWFAQLQKDVRVASMLMRVCLPEAPLKAKLLSMGLLRHSECSDTVESALTAAAPIRKTEKAAS